MVSDERNSKGNVTSIDKPMPQIKKNSAEFVVCLKNEGYVASLELHKIYRVLPDPQAEEDGDLRIVDESGEDYLYPKDWFVPIEVPEAVEASLLKTA